MPIDPAWSRAVAPAARGERHAWMQIADAALAAAPVTVSPGPTDRPWSEAFGAVLEPFVDLAWARLDRPRPGVDGVALRAGFVAALRADLVRIAARTLVLDLNLAREAGRLTGADPAARFASFVDRARTRAGLTALLTGYPVLARLLAQRAAATAGAVGELLDRLAADRGDVVGVLFGGVDPGPLVEVRTGAGDTHRGGRSVALLRFAGGARLVYKPVPLAVHEHFNDLARWYAARLPGLAVPTLRLLARDGYGWVEFVASSPCRTAGELARFYRGQGALLALLYLLDATDVHYENLIARGDEPVLIDVETLFHPDLPQSRLAGPDPAAVALEASVARVMLLPRMLLGDAAVLDISGLGGDKGASSPLEAVDWADPGTDVMRLVRRAVPFAGGDNRPVLDGVDADPGRHVESLLDGFRAGYEALVAHRAELRAPDGPVCRFADDEVRVVVRATQVYATLLTESTHPDVLRAYEDRDALFALLADDSAGDAVRSGLVDVERAELWAGDVPVFHTRPGSVDLWDGLGRRYAGLLPRSSLSSVLAKLDALGDVDRGRQEWIIRAALAGRCAVHAPDPPPRGPGGVVKRGVTKRGATRRGAVRDSLLDLAGDIADGLVASAYRGGRSCNWLGLEPVGERFWHLGPLGASLGTGYGGVALFLAELDHVRGTSRYADDVRRMLGPVPGLLEAIGGEPEFLAAVGSGAFAGAGGIAYALARIAALLDDSEIRDWVPAAVRVTGAAIGFDRGVGVLDGTAGGLACLVAVHRMTGSVDAWAEAGRAAVRLREVEPPAAAGFASGSTGVGWALARYGEAGGGDAYVREGLRRLAGARPDGPAWCTGLTGWALAVTDLAAGAADPDLRDGVDAAIRLAARHGRAAEERGGSGLDGSGLDDGARDDGGPGDGGPGNGGGLGDDSLCHGRAGQRALLSRVDADRLGRLPVRPGESVQCGTPSGVASPGLLTGLAGIGINALECAFPDLVPSAVLLACPQTTTA